MSNFALERRIKSVFRETRRLATMLDTVLSRLAETNAEPSNIISNREIAEAILEARRLREDFFGAEMFADPAWDMLLHLFVNGERGGAVSASSLCLASAVPQSTALRWIDTLADAGLVTRRPDPEDGRRNLIALSPEALGLMRLYLRRTRAGLLAGGDPGRRNGAAP